LVLFVGAAPRAPALTPRRGAALLQKADCIIYAGSLVNPALLGLAKADCAIYNSAEMTLEQVLDVMRQMEAAGKITVRLHTGDPCLYGAIREQMDVLDAEGQVPEAENAKVLETDGRVELKDVSFRYLPDRPLIEGLNLDVKPGQRIAIVGPTGCGKTTLINLLMRFYDVDSGSITLNGHDVRDFDRSALREGFGMVLQKIEGVYGFTSEFACPVDVTVYADPAAGITEKMFEEAIDAEELVIPAKEGEKVIPMHTVLKSYAVAGQVSREEFAQIMFRDVEKQAGRFIANIEKWGDDEQFPKAVYEMAFPGIEKMPIRNAFPYFKSFLSCSEGIVSVDFVLRDLTPVMRIHYVKSMWNDEKLWKEIFQAEKWMLRMADGTFKEADPRLKFTNPGKTVTE